MFCSHPGCSQWARYMVETEGEKGSCAHHLSAVVDRSTRGARYVIVTPIKKD